MSRQLADAAGASQTIHDGIDRRALDRFRATIDCDASSDHVPQGFHWCLGLPDAPTAALGSDGHPPKGGFLPPVTLPRRMWAASDIEFRAPLKPSTAIDRVSRIAKVSEKTGGGGKLVFVDVEHTTSAGGVICIVELQTIVYRDAATQPVPLRGVGVQELSAWPWRRSITPQAVLLFRYSALTFNSHRIHYDLPYATEAEGYPGLVVHGPLMATLLLDLCARELGPDCLSRFSFRAVAPAFAGQELHLVARPGETIELRALGADGRTVMSATGWQ